jgi:hypothetical protein
MFSYVPNWCSWGKTIISMSCHMKDCSTSCFRLTNLLFICLTKHFSICQTKKSFSLLVFPVFPSLSKLLGQRRGLGGQSRAIWSRRNRDFGWAHDVVKVTSIDAQFQIKSTSPTCRIWHNLHDFPNTNRQFFLFGRCCCCCCCYFSPVASLFMEICCIHYVFLRETQIPYNRCNVTKYN